MKVLRLLIATALLSLLAACGGGGGEATAEEAAPAANRAPTADAGTARNAPVGTAITLDGGASSDPDGDALSYVWALSASPTGSAATLTSPTSSRPSFTPDVAGTYTLTLSVADGRGGGATATISLTATAAVPAAIVLDPAEPVSGTTKLSLTGTVPGAVTWYVDLRLLGSGNPADGNSIAWSTPGVSNGDHQVLAVIQTGSGTPQSISRTVRVSNSTVTLTASASGTSGTINVDVRASSSFGIASVSARFDDAAFGTLTQPNACSQSCSGASDLYRFTVDAAAAGSGPHIMEITALDGSGGSKTLTIDVPVSNAPVLTLAEPLDGASAFGTLRVSGTASSDKAGAVTTTARLQDYQFLSTRDSTFSGSYDLTGVTAGTYTLTVRSTDSTGQITQVQRSVVVTSSAALAYTPVFSLPTDGRLLAAEGFKVLYSSDEAGVVVRDLVAGSEVRLGNAATLQHATDWQLSGGRVYAQAKDSDCTPTFNCIYEWNAAGVRRNLSLLSPYTAGSSYQENPVAKDGFVVWTNWSGLNPGSYTLFEVATQAFTRVARPAGVNYVGNTDYGLSASGGVAQFAFWGQTGGDGVSSQFDTFLWRSDTAASIRLTSGGLRNIYPMIDGTRMAWRQTPVGGSTDNTFNLQVRNLDSGATTSLSTKADSFQLLGGVLAWVEVPATGSRALKAATATTTTTLSMLSSAALYATGEGHVIFGEAGKTYSWSSATGIRTLRADTLPSSVFVAGGAMVLTINEAVYRVPLD